MSNTETLAFETCSRVPQACPRNSVFVINSNNLEDLDDIKSDLNDIFKRCLEAKCKIFDINYKYMKATSINTTNKLEEGQVEEKTFMGSYEILYILRTKIKQQLNQK